MSKSPDQEDLSVFSAPEFYKPLKDLSSPQGECLVLECRVRGAPPPQITWHREGDVIDDCPDFRMLHAGEVATLVIGEAFPEDTGIFTCEATNRAGTTRTSCKITIRAGRGSHSISTKTAAAAAQRFKPPQLAQVLPTTKSTSCIHTSSSTSSYHREVKTQQTHVSRLSFTPKNPRLASSKPSDAKEATYNSQLVRSPLVIERPLTPLCSTEVTSPLSVRTHSSVEIRSAHSNLVASKNRSITSSSSRPTVVMATSTYNIQLANNPDDNLNFKVEKDQLLREVANAGASPSQIRQGKQRKTNRTVAFIQRDLELRHATTMPPPEPAQERDEQEYKVSSFDQRLMSEIEYRLERTPPVNEDPEDGVFEEVPAEEQIAPSFTTILRNFKAINGTSAKFTCRVTGKPTTKVYWFKDGKQISKRSQHYIQRKDGEDGHELYIPHLCMEDDGNYTALATNPQGRVSSTGRLAMISDRTGHNDVRSPVNTAPKQSLPAKGELAADEESPVEKYYRPTFIQKPAADTMSEEGKLVRFDVKVTGLPTPNIEWLINGRPIIQDAFHKILVRENNVHSLLFERVAPMDEGQYTITASNKAGSAVANVQLHVKPREHMTAPAFVQRLTGLSVAEGDSFRLEARVIAAPRPTICWKRGSDQVQPDNRTQLYEDDSGYVCLQITQAYASDAAWYTCSATNKAGISSCNCKLDVYSPTANVSSNRRRIRTPHRYANLAKVAGVDMREALTPDSQAHEMLPESEDL